MEEAKKETSKAKEKAEIYKQTKLEFLTLIQRRFYDKISHVRAKALKKFIKIVRSDQITLEPFDLYASILTDTNAKMRDQTANVRKNALKLFS